MSGPPEGLPARARKDVEKYLLPGEQAVVVTRRHWAVPTSDDRAAFVGEAYGVWLWLVMWPMNAAWLLAEQLELLDLRDRIYPDLPLGPPSEHLLPGS